ncbi:MAG: DUF1385 domain-containing protein [Patescibacteria group bacterium]|nr:DUF1385 domain-containing protein [Patescibacteria group bacterium]
MNYLSFFKVLFSYVFILINSTLYGGQAVMNGVMMKGEKNYSISVNTSKGIKTKTFPYTSITKKYKLLNIPLLRGIVILVEMMKVGNKSLTYSADMIMMDEEESEKESGEKKSGEQLSKKEKSAFSFMMIIAVLASTAFAFGLFKVLPLGAATILNNYISIPTWTFNVVVGLTKLSIFILYIFLVSRYKDIKELFTYHGAEHKTIHCYESGQSLRTKSISSFSRIHPRCGTAFIFVVILFAIFITLFIPKEMPFWISIAFRLSLLPLIVGVSYEFQRLSARKSWIVFKILMAPGLWLQRLTTRHPSPEHISTARTALKTVILEDSKSE